MSIDKSKTWRLSERDFDFLIDTVSPEVTDKPHLKKIIREDEDFRNTYMGDARVFRRVMRDDEILLKISPPMFFEILLRKAADDLSRVGYTFEKNRTMRIPVFDTEDLVSLLNRESLLIYLADMLSSFTRIESYAVSIRIRKGVWRKIRFNDLDVHSLMSLCDVVDDAYRFSLYKRIGDICRVYFRFMPNETTAMRFQDRYGPGSPAGDGSAPRTTKERDNGFIAWLRNTESPSTWSCLRSFGRCMKISKKQKNR